MPSSRSPGRWEATRRIFPLLIEVDRDTEEQIDFREKIAKLYAFGTLRDVRAALSGPQLQCGLHRPGAETQSHRPPDGSAGGCTTCFWETVDVKVAIRLTRRHRDS